MKVYDLVSGKRTYVFWVQNENRSSVVPHHPPEVATIGKNTRK